MPVYVNDELSIPEDALTFTASRSGGPGGQHVNKTSSRVTLRMDVAHAPFLSDDLRARLLAGLGPRVGADGTVRVVCQASRSQFANRRTATERLAQMLADALTPEVPRVATKVPRRTKAARLEFKKRRASVKRGRAQPPDADD